MLHRLDFASRFLRLTCEFHTGWIHFRSSDVINNELEQCPYVESLYGPTFGFAAYAHLEIAVTHLARLLDRHKSRKQGTPVSFRSSINSIKGDYSIFPYATPVQVDSIIKDDLHWCSDHSNPDIKWLLDLRNNALSHHGAKRLSTKTPSVLDQEIYYSDLRPEKAFQLYTNLGNRISRYYEYALDEVFTWEDWYSDAMHRGIISDLEEYLSGHH